MIVHPPSGITKEIALLAPCLQPWNAGRPCLPPNLSKAIQMVQVYVSAQDMGHCVRCLASLNHRLWVGLADGRMRVLGEKTAGSPGTVQVGTHHALLSTRGHWNVGFQVFPIGSKL